MRLKTSMKTTFALALVLAMGPAACKKDEGGAAGGGGAASALGKSSFEVFPKATNMMVAISFSSLQKSSIWKKFEPQIKKSMEANAELGKIKETCGIDPMTSLSHILIGGNIEEEDMVIVVKGFKRSDMESCAKKMAEKEGEELKLTAEGKITKVENDGKTMYIGWLDDSTLITGPKAEGDKAWLEARMAGKDGLAKDSATMGLLKKVDSKATIYGVFAPSDKMKAEMGGGPVPPVDSGYASITATAGLKLNVTVSFGDEAAPKGLVEQYNQVKGMAAADPQAGKFVEKLKVTAEAKDLKVALDLNEAELTELAALVEKQLPGIMMMMGGM